MTYLSTGVYDMEEQMNRIESFTFRVNREERRLITALAARLERNESDLLRFLVRQAAHEFGAMLSSESRQKGIPDAQLANDGWIAAGAAAESCVAGLTPA